MDYFYYYHKAKEAERKNDWKEAQKCWRKIGEVEKVKTIDYMLEAFKKGDKFRYLYETYKSRGVSDSDSARKANAEVYGE